MAMLVLLVIVMVYWLELQGAKPVTVTKPEEVRMPQSTQCITLPFAALVPKISVTITTGVPHATGMVVTTLLSVTLLLSFANRKVEIEPTAFNVTVGSGR